MKKLRKITVTVFALAFALLAAVPAFAENDSVADVINHSFKAYQILSAEGVDNAKLSKVAWGSALSTSAQQTSFLNALKGSSELVDGSANIFASCSAPEDLARVLEQYEDNSDIVKAFASLAFTNIKQNSGSVYGTFENGDSVGEAGYYLFEDASDSSVSVVNPVILRMAADSKVHIEVKASVPFVEKKVKENTYDVNYSSKTVTAGEAALQYGTGYNDVADYCIGDAVPFELIGTMAANVGDYTTYYYAFKDTLSKGLTFNQSKANVTVGLYDVKNGEYALVADVTSFFTVGSESVSNGTKLTFACENILAESFPEVTPTSLIIVNYNAELNKDAVIGLDGNPNEVYLQYSNRPENPDSKGETEKDEVIVFTYEITFTKIDSYDQSVLKDAEFYLQNSDGLYYKKTSSGTRWTGSKSSATVLKSNSNGQFKVSGLDKGTYTITEKAAPDGYRLLEGSIKFTINAEILPDMNNDDNAQLWMEIAALNAPDKAYNAQSFSVTLVENPESAASLVQLTTQDKADASAKVKVSNNRLYDLPETGGTGTMIFYIGGGILIAAAIVLVVIKVKSK